MSADGGCSKLEVVAAFIYDKVGFADKPPGGNTVSEDDVLLVWHDANQRLLDAISALRWKVGISA